MHPGFVTKLLEVVGGLVGGVVGAVLGYAAGYYLLVDQVGKIGHRLFWDRVGRGRIDLGGAFESQTFWQIAVPTLALLVVGLILGTVLVGRLTRKREYMAIVQDANGTKRLVDVHVRSDGAVVETRRDKE